MWIFYVMGMAGIGLVAAYLIKRNSTITYPPPESYLIDLDEPVKVLRDEAGRYQIRSDRTIKHLRAGVQPDAIVDEVALAKLDPTQRYYFELELDNGERILTAERVLSLRSGMNFRDIGGYLTRDGRRVRWGRVYRSGMLSTNITDEDWQKISELGLKLICDMRSQEEVEADPDRVLANGNHVHVPLILEAQSMDRLRALFFDRRRLASMSPQIYKNVMIDKNAAVFGQILAQIADADNLPMVIHCTAGKDRTGVAIALLLLVLGVPDETVIADYTLTNLYYREIYAVAEKALKPFAFMRVKADDLQPLLVADGATIRAMIDHINAVYGSVEHYLLEAAGLDEAILARLRANLLV